MKEVRAWLYFGFNSVSNDIVTAGASRLMWSYSSAITWTYWEWCKAGVATCELSFPASSTPPLAPLHPVLCQPWLVWDFPIAIREKPRYLPRFPSDCSAWDAGMIQGIQPSVLPQDFPFHLQSEWGINTAIMKKDFSPKANLPRLKAKFLLHSCIYLFPTCYTCYNSCRMLEL